MLRRKRNICIKVSDDVEFQMSYPVVTGIEGKNLSSEMALCALGHAKHFDPRIVCGVLADELVGTVSRTVTDDYPLHWR
jgi:hypothetical protein